MKIPDLQKAMTTPAHTIDKIERDESIIIEISVRLYRYLRCDKLKISEYRVEEDNE